MNIHVVIATYNRPESLNKLVGALLECEPTPQRIVVVDSSSMENLLIQKYEKVIYVRSSHPNQPYQRYLGLKASDSKIVVYLDDDMEILDKKWLTHVSNQFADNSVAGVAINFKNDNDFLQNKLPKSKLVKSNRLNGLKQLIKSLSGYPQPAAGIFWLCGIRGQQPTGGGETQWVGGGAFAVKRKLMYKNFNFHMFDLFERKIGMGEDVLLGFTLYQYGKIIYLADELFYHNDQKDSSYTVDFYSYGKRVAYSRLYLSFEYVRLTRKSKAIAFAHFNWYMLWRLIGMGINQVIDFKPSRSLILKGYLMGYLLAIKESVRLVQYDKGNSWKKDALNDLNL